jgi:hypothetical protein
MSETNRGCLGAGVGVTPTPQKKYFFGFFLVLSLTYVEVIAKRICWVWGVLGEGWNLPPPSFFWFFSFTFHIRKNHCQANLSRFPLPQPSSPQTFFNAFSFWQNQYVASPFKIPLREFITFLVYFVLINYWLT